MTGDCFLKQVKLTSVRASKKVQLSRIGSRLHAFQRAIDEVRTLPLKPQRVAQKVNVIFVNKNQFKLNKVC